MTPDGIETTSVRDVALKTPGLDLVVGDKLKQLRKRKETNESKEKEPGVLESVSNFVKEGVKSTMEELRHGSTWEKVFAFMKLAGGVAAVAYVAKKAIDGMMSIGGWMKEQLGETASNTMKGVLITALGASLGGVVYEAVKGDLSMGEVAKAFATDGSSGVAKLLLSGSANGISRLGTDTVRKIKEVAGVSLTDSAAESIEAIDKLVGIDAKKEWLIETLKDKGIDPPDVIENMTTKDVTKYLKEKNVNVGDVMKFGGAGFLIYKYLGWKGVAINGGIYLMLLKDAEGKSYAKNALDKYREKMGGVRDSFVEKLNKTSPGLASAVDTMLPNVKEEGFVDGMIDIAAIDPGKTIAIANAAWMMRGVIFMFGKTMLKVGTKTPERAAISAALMVGAVWSRKELIDKIVNSIYGEESNDDEKEKVRDALYLMAKVPKDSRTTIGKRLLVDNEAQLIETIGGGIGRLEIGKKFKSLIKNGDAGIGWADGGNTLLLIWDTSPPVVLAGQAKASVMSTIDQLQSDENDGVLYPVIIGGATTMVFSSATFGAAKGYMDLVKSAPGKGTVSLKVFKSLFPVITKENRFLWKRGVMEVFEPIAIISRRHDLNTVKEGFKNIESVIGNLEDGASLSNVKSKIKSLEELIENSYEASSSLKKNLKGNSKVWELSDKVFELKNTLNNISGKLDEMGDVAIDLHSREWEGISNLVEKGSSHIDEADDVLNRSVLNSVKSVFGKVGKYGSEVGELKVIKGTRETISKGIQSSSEWMKNKNWYKGYESWKGAKFGTSHVDALVGMKDESKIFKYLIKQGVNAEDAVGLVDDLKVANNPEQVVKTLAKLTDETVHFSPELFKLMKAARVGGVVLSALGTVYSGVESAGAFYESGKSYYNGDTDRGNITLGKGVMWGANAAVDGAATYGLYSTVILGAEAGTATAVGTAALPLIVATSVGANVIDSMYERTVQAEEWYKKGDRNKLIHEWVTTSAYSDTAGDRLRIFSTEKQIQKERLNTSEKIMLSLLSKEEMLLEPDPIKQLKMSKRYSPPNKYRLHFLKLFFESYPPSHRGVAERALQYSMMYQELMETRDKIKVSGHRYMLGNINVMDEKYDDPDFDAASELISALEKHRLSMVPDTLKNNFDQFSDEYLMELYCSGKFYTNCMQGEVGDDQLQLNVSLRNYLVHTRELRTDVEYAMWLARARNKIGRDKGRYQEMLKNGKTQMDKFLNSPEQEFEKDIHPSNIYVNAVYRLAQYFGYHGEATEEAMKTFFSEEKRGMYGLYWDGDEWSMNDSEGLDEDMGDKLDQKTLLNIQYEFTSSWDDNFDSRNDSIWDNAMVTKERSVMKAQSSTISGILRRGLGEKIPNRSKLQSFEN
ncbi:MAG: hypothetical protein P1V18_02615 [Candidatus Gracilibacteria bacterium]|nr:hypothetical protein [Candidatus Gracilibacteria bacterium]